MDPKWQPQIDRNRCSGCGECVAHCPTGALAQVEGKAALAHPEVCTYCAVCEDICPEDAIALPYLICFAGENPDPYAQRGNHNR